MNSEGWDRGERGPTQAEAMRQAEMAAAARRQAPSPSKPTRHRATVIRRRVPGTFSRRSREVVVKKNPRRRGGGRRDSLATRVQRDTRKLHAARGIQGRVEAALNLARTDI